MCGSVAEEGLGGGWGGGRARRGAVFAYRELCYLEGRVGGGERGWEGDGDAG